jgi:L-ascorbate metabolism protein UlaG (beta-lactamase superfamily)
MNTSGDETLKSAQEKMARRRRALLERWPGAWSGMAGQWADDGPDALWLTYSANYLLRTGGVRWMIDPFRLSRRVPEAAAVPLDALAAGSFVLLTHNHADHVDPQLLAHLATIDHLQWVVPPQVAHVAQRAGVRPDGVIVPRPLEAIAFDGGKVRITPFPGLHWEYAGRWKEGEPLGGVDSTGYLIEWAGKRLLIPGDTRTYDPAALPAFGPVDTLLAHVWLGRGSAQADEPPLLEAFCDFVAALQPTRRVLLTHLWEQGRGPDDYWDERHAEKVRQRLSSQLPAKIDIQIPEFWKAIPL